MLIICLIYFILSSSLIIKPSITIYFYRSLLIILLNSIIIATLTDNNIIAYHNLGLFNNLFFINNINNIFTIFILILSFFIINLNSFHYRKLNLNGNWNNVNLLFKIAEQNRIIEYPIIILFIIIGAIFLMSSNDIISIFLSIELQSYGLYLLCTLYRNSELSTSAGLIYFLLGGLSSGFILLGTSLLYTNTGVTNLDNYYIINNLFNIKNEIESINMNTYVNYFLIILSIGFLFKVSAAPFHFWSPDVYDAIPTVTTTFVAIITKISLFILIFQLVYYTYRNNIFNVNWTISLLFSSLLSLIIGTILGLNQSRIKRLFAYSTISHLGFILLGISINSMESTQAFIFYLTQYSISNLNAFILLIGLGYNLYIYINKNKENDKLLEASNSPIQFISQLKGYVQLNPILSISFALTIYSLIGIPPLLGFFGKQIILSSSLDQNFIFITIIAILTSVISAIYYLNIIKNIFFEDNNYELNPNLRHLNIRKLYISISGNFSSIVSILTLIITLFIFNTDEWLNLTNIISILIFS